MKKVLLYLCFILLLTSCSAKVSQTQIALGTVCTIEVEAKNADNVLKKSFELISEIEHLISANSSESEISQINQQAGKTPVVVSEETFKLISYAKQMYYETNGSFNIAIYPLVKLWSIGTIDERVPSKEEIEKVLPLLDISQLVLEEATNKVYLNQEGMGIDLGGIGKGYVTDRLVELFNREKVKSAVIDLGGNIYIYKKESKVGIQTPFSDNGQYYTIVKVKDKAVVTSGNYERYFESNGVLYHHIFDATTGYPAPSDLLSVTIISDNATSADVLSTSGFILGSSKLQALSNKFKVEIKAVTTANEYLSFSDT